MCSFKYLSDVCVNMQAGAQFECAEPKNRNNGVRGFNVHVSYPIYRDRGCTVDIEVDVNCKIINPENDRDELFKRWQQCFWGRL